MGQMEHFQLGPIAIHDVRENYGVVLAESEKLMTNYVENCAGLGVGGDSDRLRIVQGLRRQRITPTPTEGFLLICFFLVV